jgi:hypothetical protein
MANKLNAKSVAATPPPPEPARPPVPSGPADRRVLYWGLGILGGLLLLSRTAAATPGVAGQGWLSSLFGGGLTTTTPYRAATGTQVTSALNQPGVTIPLSGGGRVNIPLPTWSNILGMFGSSSGAGSSAPVQASVTPPAAAHSPVPDILRGTAADSAAVNTQAPAMEVASQTPPVGETIQPNGTVYTPPDEWGTYDSVYQDTSYLPVDSMPVAPPLAEEIFSYYPSAA